MAGANLHTVISLIVCKAIRIFLQNSKLLIDFFKQSSYKCKLVDNFVRSNML